MRKLALSVISLILAACMPAAPTAPAAPSTVESAAPSPSSTIEPAATPTETPLPHTTVDASTMRGKVVFGYQGWFGCLNDGSYQRTWIHWFRSNAEPSATNLTVDFWPDVSELSQSELCPTLMDMADGSPAMVFSSYNAETVLRHFQWMAQYGIDGVAIQRFASQLTHPDVLRVRNRILENEIRAAEAYGRVFYIEYDFSSYTPEIAEAVKRDWADLVDNWKITESPSYLHENGLPVVELWGFGVKDAVNATPQESLDMIDFFHQPPAPQYKAVVVGGVPSYWRTLKWDSLTDPGWSKVYQSYDVLNPWAVGRYSNQQEADAYLQAVTLPDLKVTAARGQAYMPVIFPGFSWSNLFPGSRPNEMPRQCGRFYWRQAYNAISAEAPMLFVAMFDEVDEGTAMFKLAPTRNELPVDVNLVPLDADGCSLPSDWYLRLGGETGRMLRGEIPLSQDIPLNPEPKASEDAPTALPGPTPGELPSGSPFSGTWQGTDPDDGSITTITLVQTGDRLTGTFSDSFSGTKPPPGFEGPGSGTVRSATSAEMTFNLTRGDGATVQAGFRMTLSDQNNTLTLSGPGGGPPIVLHRQ